MHADDVIAITGLGLATGLGLDPEETFRAVASGRCGFGPMPALEQAPSPDKGGGQALPLAGDAGLPREVAYLRHVVAQALASAGADACRAERIVLVLGTTLHGMRAAGKALRSGDLAELRGFTAGAVAARVVEGMPIRGGVVNTCSACSSGLGAVALGVTLLRTGAADMVIAGGYDAVSEYAYAGFDSLRLVTSGPPRPFGAGRDGMKTAEGYGVLALERAAAAEARGARCRGYIAGIGESADAHHLTQPHPEGRGAAAAVRDAIGLAGLTPAEIGLISAHATATPNNDSAEYAGLDAVLGAALAEIPVVAFKSHLGHTLGGAGAVELVLAVIARERSIVPPTVNVGAVDTAFPRLRLNLGPAAPARIGATMNLSLGFGGANTCVVVTSERPASAPAAPDEPVVTGVGVVLPGAVGNGAFAALLGREPDDVLARSGPVAEDEFAHLVNARRVRRMSDYVKYALAAAGAAAADAGFADGSALGAETCAILGTMHGSSNFCESYYGQIVREGIGAANPTLFAEGVPNSGSAHLSLAFGLSGGCQTIIGSRTAGLDALRLAAMRIRQGAWARALVGASEEYCETVCRAHRTIEPDGPEAFGAGAVMLVVESRRTAAARGARVRAAVGECRAFGGGPGSIGAALGEGAGAAAAPIISALGESRHERLVRRSIDLSGRPHHTIAPWIPDVLSVSPLAGLAAALLSPGRARRAGPEHGGRIDVLAVDRCTGATVANLTPET